MANYVEQFEIIFKVECFSVDYELLEAILFLKKFCPKKAKLVNFHDGAMVQ